MGVRFLVPSQTLKKIITLLEFVNRKGTITVSFFMLWVVTLYRNLKRLIDAILDI